MRLEEGRVPLGTPSTSSVSEAGRPTRGRTGREKTVDPELIILEVCGCEPPRGPG